jgi:phage terminase large subunit
MKETVQPKELAINPLFEPLFSDNLDDPRYYQVYGGRGSGKSFTASIAAVIKTYSKFKHKILYLRQVMSTAEDSTIADVTAAIHLLGKSRDFRIKKNLITNIKTGSTISFKGIRTTGGQTAKLKSLSGITTLIVEEAEEVESFEEFSKIDESIRMKGKPLKVIMVYNPTTSIGSWIHKEWFDSGFPKESRFIDTMFIHSTYLDNIENLNQSTIDRYERLKDTNPTYYYNTIMAEWTLEAEGRIYDGWAHYPFMEEPGDTWYGLDFGYGGSDKTACVKITYLDKVYYVEEMFSEAKQSINKTVKEMRRCGIPFNARIYADSAMPLLISEIRSKGYSSIRKCLKGNVEAGIKKVINKDIVLVGGTETDIYRAYMTFRRDKKGKLPHEPDVLAAMRYGINSKTPRSTAKKDPKRRARRRNDLKKKRGDFM